MPVTLEIVEGPGAGRQVPLRSPLIVGRDPDVDLILDDGQISRRHARLAPEGSGLTIEDLGSLNGTFVNRNQVHGRAFATAGDEVLVGVTVMQVRTDADVAAQPSAVRPIPPALAIPERVPDYVPPPPPPEPRPAARGGTGIPELDALVDARTKTRAQLAPLALLVLVALIVIVYFGAS